MVSQRYLLDKPPAPGAWKRWVDQAAIPAAIDLAGRCETVLEHGAVRARRAPLLALGAAFLAGAGLAAALTPPRRRARWQPRWRDIRSGGNI